MRQQLDTALRLTLAGQVRNRFAWILLIAFIPLWYLLSASMFSHTGVTFVLRATHTTMVVDGHDIGLISTGLNSICLLTGFVVFTAARRSLPFDRRLVRSGYRPASLIAAKTSAALIQAVAVGAYAAIVLLIFWRAPGLWAIAVTFVLAAATYAALGLLLGVLVRGDLEGFFLIIMISIMDTFLQDPMDNPLANKPILEFFPSYGPTQFAAAGAFHHQVLISMAALSLGWTATFALLGLVVLRLRMPRPAGVPASASPGPGGGVAASAPGAVSARPADPGWGALEPNRSHGTLMAAAAQASGSCGRNPGENGLPADQRVVPPPAARTGKPALSVMGRRAPYRPDR